MACQRCSSDRIINASCKCSDRFFATLGDEDYDGYVPNHIGIGAGDYLTIGYCADCGQLQGTWPLPEDISLKEEDE